MKYPSTAAPIIISAIPSLPIPPERHIANAIRQTATQSTLLTMIVALSSCFVCVVLVSVFFGTCASLITVILVIFYHKYMNVSIQFARVIKFKIVL